MVSRYLLGAISGVGVSIFGALLGWVIVPPIVRKQIAAQVAIAESSPTYSLWKELPMPLDFKVYLFNVTNAFDIHRGKQLPIVKEIGPYVYKQYRYKSYVKFSNDKKQVLFRQRLNFVFDKKSSAPFTENDPVVILNSFMNVVLQSTEVEVENILNSILGNDKEALNSNPIIRIFRMIPGFKQITSILQVSEIVEPAVLGTINKVLDDIFGKQETMFLTTTPKQIFFDGVSVCNNPGVISNIVCDMIKQKKSLNVREMPDNSLRFSFFNHKNVTDDGLYEVDTGLDDISMVGEINVWNTKQSLSTWPNEKSGALSVCNMLNGSDSTKFRPYQKPTAGSLYIFNTDICRSTELVFKKASEVKGIPALHYEVADTFLKHLGPEYASECFCSNTIKNGISKPNGCLHQGALDLSPCVDAPMVITNPHMLDAAVEYTSLIRGLNPDPKTHLSFLDVEPNTGTPLRGSKRVQFNMFLRKIDQIDVTSKLKPVLMPILWVDEGVEISEDIADMLKNQLIRVLFYLNIIVWVMMIGGIVFGVGMTYWYYKKRKGSVV